MRIALNKEAGMITVNDLHDHTHIEIRDMSGNVLMEVNTITPSFTMDCERLGEGFYTLEVKHRNTCETMVFKKGDNAA